MPVFTLISPYNAHWLICPWSTRPNKVHRDAHRFTLSVMRKLQAVKSIQSSSYGTNTLPEGMTTPANQWPFRDIWHLYHTLPGRIYLCLPEYIITRVWWQYKELNLKILQFKGLSWYWIIYFRLTLVFEGLKWIPNHLLRNEHKKGLKHLHGSYKN